MSESELSESQGGNGAAASAETMVDVRNVQRTFHRGRTPVPVLRGLSLSMEKGEFLALMGPSGSGKSTPAEPHWGARPADWR